MKCKFRYKCSELDIREETLDIRPLKCHFFNKTFINQTQCPYIKEIDDWIIVIFEGVGF